MGIDTSALFGHDAPGNYKPVEPIFSEGYTEIPQSHKNGCNRLSVPQNNTQEAGVPTRLQREAERKRETERKYIEGLRENQINIQRAGQLRTDIIKAAAAGQDTTTLFLKAAECISLMTGDGVFYDTLRETVRTIHGGAYKDPVPLQQEQTETEDRLQKLRAALSRSETDRDRKRLQTAINAHEKRLQELGQILTEETAE